MIAASFFVLKFQPDIVSATIMLREGGRWFCGLLPGSYVEADLEIFDVDLVMAENSELESMELYAIFRTFFFVLVDVFAFPARAFQRLCKRDHTSAPLRQMVMKAIMSQYDRTTFHKLSRSFVYRAYFVRCFLSGL